MKRWIPVLAAAACALSGCVRVEEEAKEQKFMAGSLPLPEYAPIERYKLELNLEGRRDLVAGSPGVLHFSLTNADTQPVRIPEWYADEPKNIQLFCQLEGHRRLASARRSCQEHTERLMKSLGFSCHLHHQFWFQIAVENRDVIES